MEDEETTLVRKTLFVQRCKTTDGDSLDLNKAVTITEASENRQFYWI